MSDSRFSISAYSLFEVGVYLKKSAGKLFDALPFLRFNSVDLVSSFVMELMDSLLICYKS